jgi:hypothetical protein
MAMQFPDPPDKVAVKFWSEKMSTAGFPVLRM